MSGKYRIVRMLVVVVVVAHHTTHTAGISNQATTTTTTTTIITTIAYELGWAVVVVVDKCLYLTSKEYDVVEYKNIP